MGTNHNRGEMHIYEYCYGVDVSLETIKKILSEGADVNAADQQGTTALHVCAQADWDEDEEGIIEYLIKSGAELEARIVSGRCASWTPLMCACYDGRASHVRALLERGANPNSVNEDGMTPLMLAVDQTYETDMKAQYLVSAGADVLAKNDKGCTAINIARELIDLCRAFIDASVCLAMYCSDDGIYDDLKRAYNEDPEGWFGTELWEQLYSFSRSIINSKELSQDCIISLLGATWRFNWRQDYIQHLTIEMQQWENSRVIVERAVRIIDTSCTT